MLDLNKVKKRYFDIKLGDLTLKVEPPKMKTLKKILALTKTKSEEAMDELAEAIRLILSKNSKGHQVSIEIIDDLDYDQMLMVIEEFFKWMHEARKNDPN
jgi:hypothetical protein